MVVPRQDLINQLRRKLKGREEDIINFQKRAEDLAETKTLLLAGARDVIPYVISHLAQILMLHCSLIPRDHRREVSLALCITFARKAST